MRKEHDYGNELCGKFGGGKEAEMHRAKANVAKARNTFLIPGELFALQNEQQVSHF